MSKREIFSIVGISALIVVIAFILAIIQGKREANNIENQNNIKENNSAPTVSTVDAKLNIETKNGKSIISTENEVIEKSCIRIFYDDYYDISETTVNNIKIGDQIYTLKADNNIKNHKRFIYLNDNLVEETEANETILTQVCAFDKYIMYVYGWEGPNGYNIIDTSGNIVIEFVGNITSDITNKFDVRNTIYDTNSNDQFLETFTINLDNNPITKENDKTVRLDCDNKDSELCNI